MKNMCVIDHPLVQHKLTLLRMRETSTQKFRVLVRELSMLLGYEVTRGLRLKNQEIETPLGIKTQAPMLEQDNLALVPILRAGNGILDGLLQLLPTAKVGHIGLYRNKDADSVVEYYFKMPEDINARHVLVLDPMLATGHSAVSAVSRVMQMKPQSVSFVCLLAAPEGYDYFHHHHPEVNVYTAAIDEGLNHKKYIVPGLGDAGDRLFGTL